MSRPAYRYYVLEWRERAASLLKFAGGGVLSLTVALGTTALLHEAAGVAEQIAAGGGLAAALTVNFFVLRYVVFRGTVVRLGRQLAAFLGSSGVFRAFEYAAFLLVNVLLGVPYLLALAGVLGVSFLLKFLVYDRWVFARARGERQYHPARHREDLRPRGAPRQPPRDTREDDPLFETESSSGIEGMPDVRTLAEADRHA